MIPEDAVSRRQLLDEIKSISSELEALKLNDEALNVLVHECAEASAREVNDAGQSSQLEYLIRNGWSSRSILDRVRSSG